MNRLGPCKQLDAPIAAKSLVVGVVLDPAPIAAWQADCLRTLEQELGATLRPLAAGSAEDGAAELDLIVLLTERGDAPQALPPSRWGIWRIVYGLHAGIHCSAADVVADLLACRTTAAVQVSRLDEPGRPDRVLYSATTRIWPWAPSRSIKHLQALAPRCLRAAAMRQRDAPEPLAGQPLVGPVRQLRRGSRLLQRLLLAVAAKVYLVHAYGWRLIFIREHWGIGIVDAPLADLVRGGPLPPAQWLPSPDRFTYLADPIWGDVGGQAYLLAEQFNCWRSKGVIVAGRLQSDRLPDALPPLLESRAHLSYPFLLKVKGDAWLCPEAWETGRIERFKISPGGNALSVAKPETLLADWPGIEPTIFRHRDSWWMFCGNRSDAPDENLYLWFADRPEGPWSPHPWNPVVTDLRHARPAGPVVMVGQALIRPAQDCSRTYGGALAFMRIDNLTRTAYQETFLRRLAPDAASPWPHGLHTIGTFGQRTIIDGKRLIASPLNPLIKLVAFLRNRRRRAALRKATMSPQDRVINPQGLSS